MTKKILSLGQCAADNYIITHCMQSNFDAAVIPADTFPEALAQLRKEPCALVLVNRILDANGASGLDFITQLKEDPSLAGTPVMLVSNYKSAQEQAVTRGALPGFGKAELEEPRTLERLGALLGK